MTQLNYRNFLVDGEELSVVEPDSLDQVAATLPSPALRKWAQGTADFVSKHGRFHLARRTVGPRNSVTWIVLFETPTGSQRVHIERVTCARCHTSIDIANPTIPDLYMVLPNEKDALSRAWSQPQVPCPRCGAELERRAIWAAEAS